jgi:hypothetical protein
MKNLNDYQLTETVTVGQLKTWLSDKDQEAKEKLIEFIDHRFTNRYLKHLNRIDSGFLKMAICCLTIEALESFIQGKENTKKKGAGLKVFKAFFRREKDNFPNFEKITSTFYSGVRCGILHQAETTEAWRIRRDGELLDIDDRCINANEFVKALENSLKNYIIRLQEENLDTLLWKNALKKLKTIWKNCETNQ